MITGISSAASLAALLIRRSSAAGGGKWTPFVDKKWKTPRSTDGQAPGLSIVAPLCGGRKRESPETEMANGAFTRV
jgi:hypothetical protein